ncbi:hypothetical protein KVR01_000114 [Diaporthe batatas]|uniref:uncharacterized protein n=1 Tax=Diaporthe batatas TaxID=748121 RepID=UPI001D0590D5|nr:uncharacterized protein KVR01_000114 [Diaporthe batatas]KAG8169369.1 hypothetical protein KVR01_000114 [Diaporthe batatas]
MSDPQGQMGGGARDDGTPDAKRQRLDEQDVAPDLTKITIRIEGHAESFEFDRDTAINHSLFIEAKLTGGFMNANTAVILLEESDYAIPANVALLQQHLEWRQYVDIHADTDVDLPDDPIQELEHFGELANFWLLADYLQSRTITNAIMEELESRADDFELLNEELFRLWWEKLAHQPAWDALRGVMLALFVASDSIQDAASRHATMPRLPVSAQMAIVDEILRQRDDARIELRSGLERMGDYVDDEGSEELHNIRALADKKVAASDYFKPYTNRRDRL